MKINHHITFALLCFLLTSCSEGTSSDSSNVANTSTEVTDTSMESTVSETTADSGEDTSKNGNISANRGGNMEFPEGFESMTEEEKAEYFLEQGMERPDVTEDKTAVRENMDTVDKTALRENMDTVDKTALRESMGVANGGSGESRELPEGYEDMTSEERQTLMASMREETVANPQEGTVESASSFLGQVTEIVDNEFLLLSEDGIEKKVTIPKDLVVANGDYTRILLGMNLSIGFDEENVVISVTILR